MAYEIELTIPGAEKLMDKIDKVASKIGDVREESRRLGDEMAQAAARSDAIVRPRGRFGGMDPFERRDRAALDLHLAQMNGIGADELKGARYRLHLAEKAAQRAENAIDPGAKTQQQLLMDMILTSRFSFGRGGFQMMPLVNKAASAGLMDPDKLQQSLMDLGADTSWASKMAPMITRLALPVAASVAAGFGVKALADAASSVVGQRSQAYWMTGSSAMGAGQVSALGGFMGMSPGAAASDAVALGDRLRGGGYGAAYMRSRGIQDYGIYTVDKGKNYVQVMDEIRRIESDREAIQVARSLGVEHMLPSRDLSDGTYERLKNSVANTQSDAYRRNRAEYEAEKTILGHQWDNLVATGGYWAMKSASGYVQYANTWLDSWGAIGNADYWKSLFDKDAWHDAFMGEEGVGWKEIQRRKKLGEPMPWEPGGDKVAQEIQGKESQDFRPVKEHPEWIGGGERSRNAVPPGWKLQQMEEALNGQAQMLGAFHI